MTDLALVPTSNLASLQPQDVKQLSWFCNQAAASGLFKTSAGGNATRSITGGEAFLMASQGIELGLSPLQSLRELNIINGRVDIPASVRAARIAASPKVTEWTVDADDKHCSITAKRRDRTNAVTVTVNLVDMPSGDRTRHAAHLEDWLYARAVRRISRQYFPDLALGMETDSYPMETVVDAHQTRLAAVEAVAGTSDGEYGLHDECGGSLSLHTNTRTGGAFLLCEKCNATFPPPQSVRDAYHVVTEASPEVEIQYVDGHAVETYHEPVVPETTLPGTADDGDAITRAIPPSPAVGPTEEEIESAALRGLSWDEREERWTIDNVEVAPGPSRISPDDVPW